MAKRFVQVFVVIFILAFLQASTARPSNEDPEIDIKALAQKYAPRLRFDWKAGNWYTFPLSAESYYNRGGGAIDNYNYTSVAKGLVPTYWHAQVCGNHLHIAYWVFFGRNTPCFASSGGRNAWWNSLVVKIRDYKVNERIHEVRFSQNYGYYTRLNPDYQTYNKTHPIAYVGGAWHGFYHLPHKMTISCCYWDDARDPGNADMHMDTWLNLQQFDNSTTWMQDKHTGVWNGYRNPIFRDTWNLCELSSCTGWSIRCCFETCGCHMTQKRGQF